MNLSRLCLQINKFLIKFFWNYNFSVKTYLYVSWILQNNQQEKLFTNKLVHDFLENENKSFSKKKDKFVEIAPSLAYYLKSFSNIKKLLDYVSLILKHIFDQQLILIIPLNDQGQICYENIKTLADIECLKIEE